MSVVVLSVVMLSVVMLNVVAPLPATIPKCQSCQIIKNVKMLIKLEPNQSMHLKIISLHQNFEL